MLKTVNSLDLPDGPVDKLINKWAAEFYGKCGTNVGVTNEKHLL